MSIKLVAFDWNGTILSDTKATVYAESQVFKLFGLPATNTKEYRERYCIPIKKYWLAMGIDEKTFDQNADRIHRIFLSHYEPLEKRCRTRSGAKDILKWLQTNNITAIIYSNHIVPHIKKQVHRLGINMYFTNVLARELGDNSHMHNQTKAEKLKAYMITSKLKPHEVVSVGDTDEEIEIGKRLGCHTIALTDGFQSTKRLKACKPDFLIHNLKDLIPIIKKLNSLSLPSSPLREKMSRSNRDR